MLNVKSAVWLSAIGILMLGCQTQVIGGGSGTGGSGGITIGVIDMDATSTGGGQGGDVQLPPHDDGPAIAMLASQVKQHVIDGTSGVTTTATGGASGGDELVIFLSNAAQSCADPTAGQYSCATQRHQITVWLTPEHQAVGTYSLWQQAGVSESEPQIGNDNMTYCGGGGGTYWDGNIEVTAIDAKHVDFTLTGTGNLIGESGTADGTYSAIRCF